MNIGAIGDVSIPESVPERGARRVETGRRVLEALQPDPGETSREWLTRGGDVLADHDYGVCVHDEESGFGTRSSSLIALGVDEETYRFADGPPCRTTFVPVESQV